MWPHFITIWVPRWRRALAGKLPLIPFTQHTTVNKLVKANRRTFYSRPADGRCHQRGYWRRGHRCGFYRLIGHCDQGLGLARCDGATTPLPQSDAGTAHVPSSVERAWRTASHHGSSSPCSIWRGAPNDSRSNRGHCAGGPWLLAQGDVGINPTASPFFSSS